MAITRTRPWVALVGAVLTGCTTTIVEPYYRPTNALVEHSYVKENADFSRYTSLLSGGLEIYYPEDAAPPSEEDLERIRSSFRRAFLNAIGDDYTIVGKPGPNVLLVRAQVIDLKVIGRGGNIDPGGRLRNVVARGELTFLMEMVDSVSGEVLGRAGDRTTDISSGAVPAGWDEVDAAAEYWAGLFRQWLDRSFGRTMRF